MDVSPTNLAANKIANNRLVYKMIISNHKAFGTTQKHDIDCGGKLHKIYE